jgi:hypothetical protein
MESIRRTTDSLANGVQELGKRLYESAGVNGNSNAGASSGSPSGGSTSGDAGVNDEEVVDAEIVDEHGV